MIHQRLDKSDTNTGDASLTLLVPSDNRLSNGLANGVYLSDITTTRNLDADIKVGEAVLAQKEDGLVKLEAEGRGFNEVKGETVNLDESYTFGDIGHSDSGFLYVLGATARPIDILPFFRRFVQLS